MKKKIILFVAIAIIAVGGCYMSFHAGKARADVGNIPSLNPWIFVASSTTATRTSSTIVQIPQLGSLSGDCVGINDASGTLTGFACSGGSGASSTVVTGVEPIQVTNLVGGHQTSTFDTTFALTLNAIYTFLKGATINGTTTLGSTTNAIAVTNSSGQIIAFAGSNPCVNGQAAFSISPTGTVACTQVVTSTVGNWSGTWQGTNSSTFYLATNPNNYISGNQTITLTGQVTGSGATTIATTIASPLNISTINASTSQITNVSSTNGDFSGRLLFNGTQVITSAPATTTFTAQGATITTTAPTIATSGPLNSVSVAGQTITITSIPTSTILAGIPTSTAINNFNGNAFTLQGDGISVTSTVIGSTTTFSTIGADGDANYYFTASSSDISNNLVASDTPYTTLSSSTDAALSNGTTSLQLWATVANVPQIPSIPPGLFDVHIDAAQITGTKPTFIYAVVNEVSATGTFLGQILQTENSALLTTSVQDFDLFGSRSLPYTMQSTASRIQVNVIASVSGALLAPTTQIYYGGTSADSRLELPASTADVTNFVPYTGAVKAVNLGTNIFTTSGQSSLGSVSSTNEQPSGYLNVGGSTTLNSTLTQSGGLVSQASTTINGQATTTNLSVNQQVNIPWTTDATGTTAATNIIFGTGGERQTITITTTTVFSVAVQNGWQGLLDVCQDTVGSRAYSFLATTTNILGTLATTTVGWASSTAPSAGNGQTTIASHCDDFSFYGKTYNLNTAQFVVHGQFSNNNFPF